MIREGEAAVKAPASRFTLHAPRFIHQKAVSRDRQGACPKSANMKRPLRLAIIGCGSRAKTYTRIAAGLPELYETVAAVDPIPSRRDAIKSSSGNSSLDEYETAEQFLALPKCADIVVLATQDHQHGPQAIAAIEKGYDLLLEKPIATSLEDVLAVEEAANRLERRVVVCHVLRYAPFYQRVKEIVTSGALGRIISIQATEGVGTFHQAHSYVRGHWNREEESSPMILAKSSHDMDILHWLADSICERVSSYGGVSFFRPESRPAGATDNCFGNCPHVGACAYDAHLYLTSESMWLQHIQPNLSTVSQSPEETLAWLKTSPWSRCVYQGRNSAVDHQVVLLEFQNGITATFTMTAFAKGRTIEIYGTDACLRGGEFYKETFGCDIVLTRHDGKNDQRINVDFAEDIGYSGHGGGDSGLMKSLHAAMTSPSRNQKSTLLSSSVESHRMAFAANESRKNGGAAILVRRADGHLPVSSVPSL